MPDTSKRYEAVVFDLDGTLADSLADLASATNHALTQLGHSPIELVRYRSLVGQGLKFLITHALGPGNEQQYDEALALFSDHYDEHMGEQTRVYPGVSELLTNLRAMGLKLGVLTNKQHSTTLKFMSQHFADHPFDVVLGQKPDAAPKPDPAGAMALLTEIGVEPAKAVYLGDTDVDMKTGRNTGMFTVGCSWGFRPDELADTGAQAIIDRPLDLLRFL